MEWSTEILIAATSLSLICIIYNMRTRPHKNAPPSLPWLPIVGSLPFLSQISTIQICFMEKAKRYGNVYSFYSGSTYTVVVNGYDAIREALVKRSIDFAGRNEMYAEAHVWNPDSKGVAFRQYSENFKTNKKISVITLKKLGIGERPVMESIMHQELEDFIEYIQEQNNIAFDIDHGLRISILNIIYSLMFGKRLKPDDPKVQYIIDWIHVYEKSLNPVLDLFPIARFLPPFRQMLKDIVPQEQKVREFFVDLINECLSGSSDKENFVTEFMKMSGDNVDQVELYYIMKDFLSGGANTGVTQILWDLIMITNHSRIQKRLQEEIDAVIPRERLPSINDKLPYLEATWLEVMRLKTITPLTVPHATTCDTEVAGYFIPAHTQVVVNLWSAHMDPAIWDEPEEFRPERFLNDQMEVINRDQMLGFGLGTRRCPGETLARQEVLLFLAALLQRFDFLPPEGQEKIPEKGFINISYNAEPFKIRFRTRSF